MTNNELRHEYQKLVLQLKQVRESIALLGEQLIIEQDTRKKEEILKKLQELRNEETLLDQQYYACFEEINQNVK